ncbi:hypothetical protein D7X75_20680 [Corallococcus sp. CA031C]|nr:hypothetical protein D7X75_20680 [Corallococcus sp. CA031C]
MAIDLPLGAPLPALPSVACAHCLLVFMLVSCLMPLFIFSVPRLMVPILLLGRDMMLGSCTSWVVLLLLIQWRSSSMRYPMCRSPGLAI